MQKRQKWWIIDKNGKLYWYEDRSHIELDIIVSSR